MVQMCMVKDFGREGGIEFRGAEFRDVEEKTFEFHRKGGAGGYMSSGKSIERQGYSWDLGLWASERGRHELLHYT